MIGQRRKKILRGTLCVIGAMFALAMIDTWSMAGAADEVPLRLADAGHHQVAVLALGGGAWELRTSGNDPYVITSPAAAPYDLTATPILSFEYLCVGGLDEIEVFAGPGWSPQRRVAVKPLAARQGWSPFAIDVAANAAIAGAQTTAWRIDLGTQPGCVLQLRNLRLRARSIAEQQTLAAVERKRALDHSEEIALRDYLARDYPAQIAQIVVATDALTITGALPQGGEALVAEWPVWQPVAQTMHFAATWPVHERTFTVTVPRFATDGADRALSRFVLVSRRGADDVLLSHGRWPDVIPAATTLPALAPRTKKGLGGFTGDAQRVSDLDELGIGSVTVNIALSSLFQDGPGDGVETTIAGGRTWHLRAAGFANLDATMLAAAKRQIVVLAIILVPPARSWPAKELGALLQHPDYDPAGIFTMPNLTTAESTAAYVMALDALAKRYTRADGKYGRVHHWIMHNEMDMGWEWTNCGKLPELVSFDQYYRSMRLADVILRRQDAHAQVFISLTHDWAKADGSPGHFAPLDLLGHLLALSRAEGDFPWGIAYHPYPSSLFEPKSWLDREAVFGFDTPQITFRNLEVLDAWMHRPDALFRGQVRSLHLSEQGPNSRDYSAAALAEQAAAMAYVWKKIARLDSILGFEYHNWADNRHEGGLRIGLHRFPDDEQDPAGRKPIWSVYRALGTPDEDRACAFALPIIGIKDWSEIIHRDPIPAHAPVETPKRGAP